MLRDLVTIVHLSDTTRSAWRHDEVGRGDVPFAPVRAALDEIGYAGTCMLEIIDPQPEAAILRSHRALAALGFTNAPASIAPWGARKRVLGTNPWSLAVPAGSNKVDAAEKFVSWATSKHYTEIVAAKKLVDEGADQSAPIVGRKAAHALEDPVASLGGGERIDIEQRLPIRLGGRE